jgi:hypothetical protein
MGGVLVVGKKRVEVGWRGLGVPPLIPPPPTRTSWWEQKRRASVLRPPIASCTPVVVLWMVVIKLGWREMNELHSPSKDVQVGYKGTGAEEEVRRLPIASRLGVGAKGTGAVVAVGVCRLWTGCLP